VSGVGELQKRFAVLCLQTIIVAVYNRYLDSIPPRGDLGGKSWSNYIAYMPENAEPNRDATKAMVMH
jgi:hypothetical protein